MTPLSPISPNWHLLDGDFVDYAVMSWQGGYDRASGVIGINGATRALRQSPWSAGTSVRMTCQRDPNAQKPMVKRVDTDAGVKPLPGQDFTGKALYDGPCIVPGLPAYIGEVGSSGCDIWPAEPKLTINPVTGEMFVVDCGTYIYQPDGSYQQVTVPCCYRTIWIDQPWGTLWPHTVRTSLEERYTTPGGPSNYAYNYVYANGALVDSWWGEVGVGDFIADGWQLYGVGVGM